DFVALTRFRNWHAQMMLSEEVALKLLQINAIRLSPQNPFTWASGMLSPIYCDNRLTLSYPPIRSFITDAFASESTRFAPFDCVAGVATAGIAHGALLAQKLDKPFVYVRSSQKQHGRQNRIEGLVAPGQSVLVIEDLISTGGSCLRAVEALREAGCAVRGVMAIFQYNFAEARTQFDEQNCPFHTLSDYETLISVASRQDTLSEVDLLLLSSWHTNPRSWTPQTTLET
ncbi:MAG: orotate phosphoribosyltransferase, partial [Saprospiraceae bacterium]|nr:orotate phosphoribosyltransferase [Saprospiraceae bacterium]